MGPGITYSQSGQTMIGKAWDKASSVMEQDGGTVHGSATDSHSGNQVKQTDYALLFDTDESNDKVAWSEGSSFQFISVDFSGTFNTSNGRHAWDDVHDKRQA